MSRRTLSGVERTGSLPEEHFMNSVAGHSAETRPSPFVEEHNHLLRRNSLPSKRNFCYILTSFEFVHPFLPLGVFLIRISFCLSAIQRSPSIDLRPRPSTVGHKIPATSQQALSQLCWTGRLASKIGGSTYVSRTNPR